MKKYLVLALLLVLGACGSSDPGTESPVPKPGGDLVITKDVINKAEHIWDCSPKDIKELSDFFREFYTFNADNTGNYKNNCSVSKITNGYITFKCDNNFFRWSERATGIDVVLASSVKHLDNLRVIEYPAMPGQIIYRKMDYTEGTLVMDCVEPELVTHFDFE